MQTTTIQAPAVTRNLPTSISQVLATPGSGGIIFSGASFCNKTAGAVTVNFTVYDGTNDTYIAFQQTIAPFDTLTFGGDFFKAQITNGWSLRALCNTASAVDVSIFSTLFT